MKSTPVRYVSVVVMVSFFALSMLSALTIDSDFGRLEVKAIPINNGIIELSSLLYRPYSASDGNPFPAIVIAHGIGGSKEMMSSIGLELAKRGFVTLCLDLYGHGKSESTVSYGEIEPSFGVHSAVQYLRTQPFVNESAIGLVGHSLGAGAARAAVAQNNQIMATVLIAGGLDEISQTQAYGVLNATFPKNLLVIIGKYDVLFDLKEVEQKELSSAFCTQEPITPGKLYGDFLSQTARKLVTPSTTHLFEIVDPSVVSETVTWMENSLRTNRPLVSRIKAPLTYLWRELAIILGLAALFGIIFVMFFPITKFTMGKKDKRVKRETSMPNWWKLSAIWGSLQLALFLPAFAIGFAIPFPPLIFGGSIAWWFLLVGLLGLLILSKMEIDLKALFVNVVSRKHFLVAIFLFMILFIIASSLEIFSSIGVRIISPILRNLTQTRRISAFLTFVPFFVPYFIAEGSYLHGLQNEYEKKSAISSLHNYGKVALSKTTPYLVLIALTYLPKIFLNIWVLPNFVGFLVEFLWLILPVFIITTTCSWWFYRNTQRIGIGVIFNALMLAWISAAIFPF